MALSELQYEYISAVPVVGGGTIGLEVGRTTGGVVVMTEMFGPLGIPPLPAASFDRGEDTDFLEIEPRVQLRARNIAPQRYLTVPIDGILVIGISHTG